MAYCFKRKESVAKAVRRLGRERIEHAFECLKGSDRSEVIHCARKDIKKVRAVLRLVRARIPKKDFRRLVATLRKAAGQLAAARDAQVKIQTLRKLEEHFKNQLAPGALRRVRAELRKNLADQMKRFAKEKATRAVEKTLHGEMKALQQLKVSGSGWKTVGPGVKATYRAGRRAYRTVLSDRSPENFHEWRKRAKDLWYHVRLLQPVWPEQMDAMASELDALGEALGDGHDLFVLRQSVEQLGNGQAREVEILKGLIEERGAELRTAALMLGARLYAEKPAMLCNRLAGYWHTWRREKKPLDQSVMAGA